MKQIIPSIQTLVFSLLLSFVSNFSYSQVSISSTDGYQVNINVEPTAILTDGSSSCQYGYGYTVKLKYSITFTGSNKPSNLWVIQGTIGNNSKAIYFDLPEVQGAGYTISSNDYRNQSDCGTASTTSFGYSKITLTISGPGISTRTVSYTYAAGALGIKLLDFTANNDNNNVDLKWATASENNNEFFSIERSATGTDWSEIKRVKGAGNSTTVLNYETVDESPLTGTSYYRLKQTDIDGTVSYSAIKAVKFAGIAKAISIFPVPNTGNTVSFKGITDFKNNLVSLLNVGGNTVYTAALTRSSIELPSVPTGIYFIRIMNKMSGETTNLRYVKI